MTFTAEQITHMADWTKTPNPGQDSHWWMVDLGGGRQPGWLYAARSLPRPSDEWVADKLNRLERQAGESTLEAALRAAGGMRLEVPRPEDG
jgi:hypothetical protein